MTKLYSTTVTIYATAYILADSPEEALEKAAAITDTGIEFSNRRQDIGDDGLCISGESYSADMPEISLSPAMTIGPVDTDPAALDEVEDFTDEDDDPDYDENGNLRAGVDNA